MTIFATTMMTFATLTYEDVEETLQGYLLKKAPFKTSPAKASQGYAEAQVEDRAASALLNIMTGLPREIKSLRPIYEMAQTCATPNCTCEICMGDSSQRWVLGMHCEHRPRIFEEIVAMLEPLFNPHWHLSQQDCQWTLVNHWAQADELSRVALEPLMETMYTVYCAPIAKARMRASQMLADAQHCVCTDCVHVVRELIWFISLTEGCHKRDSNA